MGVNTTKAQHMVGLADVSPGRVDTGIEALFLVVKPTKSSMLHSLFHEAVYSNPIMSSCLDHTHFRALAFCLIPFYLSPLY